MQTNSKITIELGFANLVAELYNHDSKSPEITVYLEDKTTGLILQDIALIRQAIQENSTEPIPDKIDCLVWADKDNEDYTNKFVIDCYIEE